MVIEEEVETKVAENQISFDFLNETENDVKTLTSSQNHDWVAQETLVIVVKPTQGFSCEFDLCGKKMIDWVKMATYGCKQKEITEPAEENFLETIKRESEGFEFVAVLYCDTPLLKKSTFLEIMDHFSKNRMNVLKLKRGYVFRGEFLQNAKMILSTQVSEFGDDDFFVVNNSQSASFAFTTLQNRILQYHKSHGVTLLGENTIFIDADVEIDEGTIIYPNNVIKGESVIGHCVILESGNYIYDSVVCDEAFVCQSYVEKSKIGKGACVGPFAKLVSEEV